MPSDAPTPAGGVALEPEPTAPTPSTATEPDPPDLPRPRARRRRSRWLYEARDGAIVAASSALITAWLFKIWEIPLRLPFLYQRDGIAQIAEVKGIIENGWYQFNPRVGWPIGYDHHDFPIGSDNLHYLGLKVMTWFSHDPVLVTNAYYLLSFVLVALSTFYVVRYLGVSRRFSFVAAMLYTFLPYHFLRGTWHLSLAAYYLVPVACLFTIMVWRNAPPFFRERRRENEADGSTTVRFEWKRWSTLWFVVGCFAIASDRRVLRRVLHHADAVGRRAAGRDGAELAIAGVGIALTAIIGFGVVVNLSPSILYWRDHGKNDARRAAHRRRERLLRVAPDPDAEPDPRLPDRLHQRAHREQGVQRAEQLRGHPVPRRDRRPRLPRADVRAPRPRLHPRAATGHPRSRSCSRR